MTFYGYQQQDPTSASQQQAAGAYGLPMALPLQQPDHLQQGGAQGGPIPQQQPGLHVATQLPQGYQIVGTPPMQQQQAYMMPPGGAQQYAIFAPAPAAGGYMAFPSAAAASPPGTMIDPNTGAALPQAMPYGATMVAAPMVPPGLGPQQQQLRSGGGGGAPTGGGPRRRTGPGSGGGRQAAPWQLATAAVGDPSAGMMGGMGMGAAGGAPLDFFGLGGAAAGGMVAPAAMGGVMTVEDILAVLQALPRGRSAVLAVGHCLGWLDSRALAALFKELHKASLAPLATELFDWLRELPPGHEYGPLLDVYTYTTMIAQCTGPSQLRRALALVADMRARGIPLNTHTYSAILNVCIKAGQPDLALDVYSQMLSEGLTPNLVTYNTLLEVYAKQAQWEQALSTLEALQRQGLSPETRTYNVVMAACNAAGRYPQSLAVFKSLMGSGRTPTTASLNSAITAYCKLGDIDAAWAVMQDMLSRGCDRTHATFMALLHAAEGAAQWRVAVEVLDAMAGAGVRVTPQAYAAAVGACAAAGELRAARELTAKLEGPPGQARSCLTAPAHMLIALHDRCCDWAAAHAVLSGLEATGVAPDSQILGALISALWACGTAAGCLAAAKLFDNTCRMGVFRLTVRMDDATQQVVFALPAVGPGMAVVALWRLFQELTARLESGGPNILRQKVVLLVGQEGDRSEPRLPEALRVLFSTNESPLSVDDPNAPCRSGDFAAAGPDRSSGGGGGGPSSSVVRITANGDALARWLVSGRGAGGVSPGGPWGPMEPALAPSAALEGLALAPLLSQQEAALVAAGAAYARLREAAAGGAGGDGGAGGPPGGLQSGAASSGAPPARSASPGSGMLFGLSDCAPSGGSVSLSASDSMGSILASGATAGGGGAGGSVAGGPAATTTAASTSTGAGGGGAATSASLRASRSVASTTSSGAGPGAGPVAAALAVLQDALLFGAAPPAAAAAAAAPPDAASLLGCGAGDVAAHAAAHPLAAGLPAHRVAELALCAARRAAGLWPAWPRALVVVAGCADPEREPRARELLAPLQSLAAAAAAAAVAGARGTSPPPPPPAGLSPGASPGGAAAPPALQQ